jgi:hypothetical protein
MNVYRRKVGLPGFEPGSRTPEAQSLDQASRQPLYSSLDALHDCLPMIIKTLAKLQRLRALSKRIHLLDQYSDQKNER